MKNKFLITACFVLFTICAQAQDKYQFMIIGYHVWKPHINISIDGNQFLKEDVDITKEEKDCAANPLLRKVKEYRDKVGKS